MSVKTYDPKKNLVIFGGIELKGFSEDSIIEAEPLGDGMKTVVGCDGETARSIDPNQNWKVTVKLMASSASNDYLSAVHTADKNTGNGILPLLFKDLSGRTTFFASQAWITKPSNIARAKELGENEWVFETGPADVLIGGNS